MSDYTMDKNSFTKNVTEDKRTALVEFWAPWCSHCKRIAPIFQKAAGQNGDRLLFGQINVDDEPDLARRYEISAIPTLLLFQDGQVQGSVTAPGSIAQIEDFINQYLYCLIE